jgi:hypothetical protein
MGKKSELSGKPVAFAFSAADERPEAKELLASLKTHLASLETVLSDCEGDWGAADVVYRFYHQSFKIYHAQETTVRIVHALQEVAPQLQLNRWFKQIVNEGTGKSFVMADNRHWLEVTRPILEAYFHARHFLEMAIRSAQELNDPPSVMPSSWASVLYLYGLR